jgi:uncharacterized protein (TIGR04255 family)
MHQKYKFTINFAETFLRLQSAPVVEAIIYWQAQAGVSLENSLLAKLQEQLPDYPHADNIHEFITQTTFAPDGMSAETHQRNQWQGVRLRNSQNTYVAQIRSQGVIFSRLPPYENWDTFVDEAMRFWRVFLDIAQPIAIQKLGVRFINRIPMNKDAEPSQYLNNVQTQLPQLGWPVETFFYQDLYRVPGYPYFVSLGCVKETPINDQNALIVDIDVYTSDTIAIEPGILSQKLREMRWLKDKTFFTCITETAKDEFRGSKI